MNQKGSIYGIPIISLIGLIILAVGLIGYTTPALQTAISGQKLTINADKSSVALNESLTVNGKLNMENFTWDYVSIRMENSIEVTDYDWKRIYKGSGFHHEEEFDVSNASKIRVKGFVMNLKRGGDEWGRKMDISVDGEEVQSSPGWLEGFQSAVMGFLSFNQGHDLYVHLKRGGRTYTWQRSDLFTNNEKIHWSRQYLTDYGKGCGPFTTKVRTCGDSRYLSANDLQLTVDPNENVIFNHWELKNCTGGTGGGFLNCESCFSSEELKKETICIPMPDKRWWKDEGGDYHAYIRWTGGREGYNLSVSSNEGANVNISPDQDTYEPGETVDLKATIEDNDEYLFGGWTIVKDSESFAYSKNLNITMYSDVHAHAHSIDLSEPPAKGATVDVSGELESSIVWNAEKEFSGDRGYMLVLAKKDTGTEEGWINAISYPRWPKSDKPYTTQIDDNGNYSTTFKPNAVIDEPGTYRIHTYARKSPDKDVESETLEIEVTGEEPISRYLDTEVVEGSGSIAVSPEKESYNTGELVDVSANPSVGFEFESWSGDVEGIDTSSASVSITMDNSKTLKAHFAEITEEEYEITKEVVGEGSIVLNPNKTEYSSGDSVSVTAEAASGFEFDHWSGDISGTSAEKSITVDSDMTLTAHCNETTEEEPEEPIYEPEPEEETEEEPVSSTDESKQMFMYIGLLGAFLLFLGFVLPVKI